MKIINLKSYEKKRIYFREKESKKVPSFNQTMPKFNKVFNNETGGNRQKFLIEWAL